MDTEDLVTEDFYITWKNIILRVPDSLAYGMLTVSWIIFVMVSGKQLCDNRALHFWHHVCMRHHHRVDIEHNLREVMWKSHNKSIEVYRGTK